MIADLASMLDYAFLRRAFLGGAAIAAMTGLLGVFVVQRGLAFLGDGLAHASFGGIATFRSFDGGDLVRRVPHDRLLVETDSPYLAPVPMRGKRNEPAFLPHTCARLAELRGVSTGELVEQTTAAALAFYRIEVPLEPGDAP